MTAALPESFRQRMKRQLGDGYADFLRALSGPPVRGIRMNTLKATRATSRYENREPIPWAKKAFLLDNGSDAGSTVLHETGAFYIQEPFAMLPAAVLDARPGEYVLDLCSAPGGKATQLGCAMEGSGLLVCNEPVPKRAQILSRNIERFGLSNTVITCAEPQQLARLWPEAFDAVLVDAPCSGEGMFRREPDSIAQWSEERAAGCAGRQREILSAAVRMVRPGGRLVYSTCTYNPQENEENAAWLKAQYPEFAPEAFRLPGIDAPEGLFTCYPHLLPGEGQFTALFRKAGNGTHGLRENDTLPRPSKEETKIFRDAFPSLPAPSRRLGSALCHLPFCPDLNRIRVVRLGLHLGEVRGKTVIPDHAAALWSSLPPIRGLDMLPEEAKKYFAGETIESDLQGWLLMRSCGLACGWGKGSEGFIRNHYPKGLRFSSIIL